MSAAQQGQLAVSIEQFGKAAEWKPDLANLDRNWGIVSFRAGEYGTAIPPLSRQLRLQPQDALIRRMLGVSYYLTKSFPQAVETLKPLEPTITSDPELAYIYGVSWFNLQTNNRRAKCLRGSRRKVRKTLWRAHMEQGFAMLEDYERAIKEFRSAAALDPKMLHVHYNAGQSLIRLNRLEEAEKEFRAELLLNSADVIAKYHLAYVLLEQKREITQALALLRETLQSIRNMPMLVTNLVRL